jgi:DNA-directed RNA polymerase subunit RPC12/RpoP
MADFVTIASYDDYITANFNKQKLEERGILCYLADENLVTVQWTLKNALGGIRLRVPGDQEEEALRILSEEVEDTPVDFRLEETPEDVNCPNCGSNNTVTEKYSKSLAGWTWLILGFPVTATPVKHYRCFYCGNKWEG